MASERNREGLIAPEIVVPQRASDIFAEYLDDLRRIDLFGRVAVVCDETSGKLYVIAELERDNSFYSHMDFNVAESDFTCWWLQDALKEKGIEAEVKHISPLDFARELGKIVTNRRIKRKWGIYELKPVSLRSTDDC